MSVYRILHRRGTAAAWTDADPVLATSERGFQLPDEDFPNGRWKTGKGGLNWSDLPYDDDPEVAFPTSTVTGRAVITGDAAEGRTALGATTAAAALTDAQARIAAWAGADAYIDFTNKADGDPPSVLDTGQAVDFVYGSSNWKPRIVDGKLLAQATLPGSNYADYYQATLDEDCHAFGTRFTVDTADGSTQGIMCIAVWAGVYQTQGTVVPHSPAHITIDTTTGGWQWWVNGPGATYPTSYLKAAKTGTFTPPASDGDAVWETAGFIDADNGIAYLYLPGPDVATGSRIVTVTDAEIAASMTAQSVPVTTLAACLDGANVVMVEHQANATANTALLPRFLDMWGETRRLSRDRGRALRVRATVAPAASAVQYAPTTQQAKTIGTSTTIVYTDTGNTVAATVTATAGPTGRINFRIPRSVSSLVVLRAGLSLMGRSLRRRPR